MDFGDVRNLIDDRLRQVNTCMPGIVETYDAARREATVVPQVDSYYASGQKLALPVLTGVPVVQITTGSAGLVLPIAKGDPVLVLFAQRSLDRWLSTGNRNAADDGRMHAMSDGIAIAGLMPFTETHVDGDGVVLFDDAIKIRLHNGTVAIGTALVELLDEITKALDEIVSLAAGWGAPTVQVQLSSAAIKTIMGSI